jgi:ribosomal-protein-serine acetyltransferase
VSRWMPWCHPQYGRKDVDQWIAHCESCWSSETGDRYFVVLEAGSQQFLGSMGLNQFNRVNHFANLGYWVRTSRARQGFTTAGVRLLARYGFERLGLARIEIVAQVENVASRGVAEKAGCTLEGIARNRLAFRERHFDAAMYSLTPGDIAAL